MLNLHTLLLKTVTFCNLACDYCYTRQFGSGRAPAVMSQEVVSRAIRDYAELAAEGRGTGPKGQWMAFIWHGGEPLLAGRQFFEQALRLQQQTGQQGSMINCMTSNGTLIDRGWADFMKRNDFRVSISIDGPKHIHDLHRSPKRGSSSFGAVREGMEHLSRSDHPCGVMCVVSEETVKSAREIFDFFVDSDLKRLAFIPRVTKESWLPSEEYAWFMTQVFDLWLERNDPAIHIRELENIIHELMGGTAELCELNGCCGSYLAVDCDGSVYLCDLFIGDDSLKVGNIVSQSLRDMLDSGETLDKISLKSKLHRDCCACGYLSICKGGCLYRRRLTRGVPWDKDIYCEARKRVIAHISARLSSIVPPDCWKTQGLLRPAALPALAGDSACRGQA